MSSRRTGRLVAAVTGIATLAGLGLVGCAGTPDRADAAVRSASPSASPSATMSPNATMTPGAPRGTVSTHRFVLEYAHPQSAKLKPAMQWLKASRALEESAAIAEQTYQLPRDIPIVADQCGEANAAYSPKIKAVVVCYELPAVLMTAIQKATEDGGSRPDPSEISKAAKGALIGALFHEYGHMLIDLYDLPATGREEDNADQVAAYTMINGPHTKEQQAYIDDMIVWFAGMANMNGIDRNALADVHSLDIQRVYNMACYLYGSDPHGNADLVSPKGLLPKDRAKSCPEEYQKMASAWSRLLGSHLIATPTPAPTGVQTPSPSVSPSPSPSPTR